ncbi:MAG: transaldolase family protein [Anaerolineales bacterium]
MALEPTEIDNEKSLTDTIRSELRARQRSANRDPLTLVLNGRVEDALNDLLFYTPPKRFGASFDTILAEIAAGFDTTPARTQRDTLSFVADLSKWLRSFLPRWNLQNPELNADAALSEAALEAMGDQAAALAVRLARSAPDVEKDLLCMWRGKTAARFKAEGDSHPEQEADAFVGDTLDGFLTNITQPVHSSKVRKIAQMQLDGLTPTRIGNDYAAHLRYAQFVGASFVTCNPPLVDLAWQANPARWDPIVDGVIRANPLADPDRLALWVTLEFVLSNMLLLRPIFLLTLGETGCVCLQVNPHKHADAEAMIADARAVYAELRRRLSGGVPNVVFKLPGTLAGLHACRDLTADGIGVTITVNFGLFQHLPFAAAIQQGQAIFSTLAHMSGRLAFPVRDELLSMTGALAAAGIDESMIREAAAWSGIAVLKRLHREMETHGIDRNRVRPLIASLKMYAGAGYEALPSPCPDITEAVGTGIITVFPNVRRAFDSLPIVALDPRRVEQPAPERVLKVLQHSQIFKQAYWVPGSDVDPAWRPTKPLTLEDVAGTAAWLPVSNTLGEFVKAYDTFVDRILARREALTEGATA